jgi:DNA-binding response OmpR family regulator
MYRLLIVGQDRRGEEDCRQELLAEGFDVEVVSDPEEAVSKVRDNCPHLIILDLCMPRGGGINCLESVREWSRGVPVVLHTAYPESWGDFRLWSADSYVQRSDDLTELKKTVRNLLPSDES